MSDDEINSLREVAFNLSCEDQFRLAFFIAENVGYVLVPDPLRRGQDSSDDPGKINRSNALADIAQAVKPAQPAASDRRISDQPETANSRGVPGSSGPTIRLTPKQTTVREGWR